MNGTRNTRQAAALLAVAIGTLCGTAAAQGNAAAPAAGGGTAATAREDESLLQEIVITADRRRSFGADLVQAGTFRGAELIDTPLTVNVLPRELLDAQQATQLHDALRNTAGVTSAQLNNAVYSNMSVRGIVVENRGNYRLNGSLPVVNLIDLPLENKERVEVLKGVSALYYGFTTPSGIVNLTSKRPPAERVLDMTVFSNQHGTLGGHVDFGQQTADGRFGVRINALLADLDIGVDETRGERSFVSLAADWKPTDALTLQLDIEHIEKSMSEPTTYFVATPAAGAAVVLPPLPDAERNLGGAWQQGDGYADNVLLSARYRLARDWEFSAQAGRSYLKRDRYFSQFQNFNLATGDGRIAVTLTNGNVNENNNYRAELSGAFFTGPLKHEVTFGYTHNKREAEVPTNPTCNFPTAATATCAASTFQPNLFRRIALPELPLPARVVRTASSITDKGLYAFNRISYAEWLQVLVGLRRADYSSVNQVLVAPTSRSTYEVKETTPAVGVVIKPREWLSLYGTYIEGLEEGGIAGAAQLNAGEVLPPNTSEQYELGIKAEFGKVLATVAYFDIDRASSFVNTAINRFVQDGRTAYQGFEFSAAGEVTDAFSVYFTAMTLDAKQERTATAALRGLRPENAPKFTASLFAEYRIAAVPGLSVSAGVFHVGDRPINQANIAFADGYTTYDVGARYETQISGRSTTFRLYADNVTDERYWAATASSLLNANLPPTVKFSVTTRFGVTD
jgi:iron complex outermembrane receptor protein